jgi:hypothetical protein
MKYSVPTYPCGHEPGEFAVMNLTREEQRARGDFRIRWGTTVSLTSDTALDLRSDPHLGPRCSCGCFTLDARSTGTKGSRGRYLQIVFLPGCIHINYGKNLYVFR